MDRRAAHATDSLARACVRARARAAAQVALGACAVRDVAVRVLTRVVGHYPASNTLLIDCGWTGCSAQGAATGYGGFPEHPELRIVNLKQVTLTQTVPLTPSAQPLPRAARADDRQPRAGMRRGELERRRAARLRAVPHR